MEPGSVIRGPFSVLAPPLRRHAVNLVIAVCAAIGAQLMAIPLPLMARWILKHTTQRAYDAEALVRFEIALAAVVLLLGVFRFLESMFGARLAQRVIAEVRERIYAHLQRLPSGYLENRGTGRTLIRFVGDANALQNWLSRVLVAAPANVLALIVLAILMATIQPALFLAAFAPLLVIIPAQLWINPRARRWTRESMHQRSHLCDHLAERVSSMKAVKAANRQLVDRAQTTGMIQRLAAVTLRRARLEACSAAFSIAGGAAVIGMIVLCGAWLLHKRAVTYPDLTACLLMAVYCRGPINRLSRANLLHQRARVAVERIHALLARPTEPGWSDELQRYSGPVRSIRLKRLGRRSGEEQWVIRDLSCKIRGPGLVAVSGEAGNAKTLLLEMLLRLRLPHEGSYYLDEHDVRTLRVEDVRRQFRWVDRQATCFPPLGDGEVENPACAEVLRGLDFLLPAAPGARLTSAGFDASRLSRGERLRAALATALAGDPPALLLDDPTAGLDADRATKLIEWLSALAREKLVIVATQDQRVIDASTQALAIPSVTDAQRSSQPERTAATGSGVAHEASDASAPPSGGVGPGSDSELEVGERL